MTDSQLISLLQQNGWQIKSQEGSHVQLIHASAPGVKITIPKLGEKDFPPGTLHSILRQAGLE